MAETPGGPQAGPRESAADGEASQAALYNAWDDDAPDHEGEYGHDDHDDEFIDDLGDDAQPDPSADREFEDGPDEPSAHRPNLADVVAAARSRLAEHGPDLLVGALIAFGVAAGAWLAGAALVLGIWAFSAPDGIAAQGGSAPGGAVAAPLHFAGQLWLAAHHVRLRTPDGSFGLTPLGFTLLPATALYLLGRANAAPRPGGRAHTGDFAAAGDGEQRPADRETGPTASIYRLAAVAVCYPAAALAILPTADEPGFRADPAAAIVWPLLLAVCCFGAGLWAGGHPLRLGVRATVSLRAAAASFATLISGSALLAAIALTAATHQAAVVAGRIAPGPAGMIGLFLIQAALVPNLAVWALGFAAGPGFAVGPGSRIAATAVVHGPLPSLPVLQAVPGAGTPSAWYLLVFALPVAAAAVLVLLVGRALRGAGDRIAAAAVAAVLAGSAAGLAAALSGGPVAAGAESVTGPAPAWAGLAVAAELGVLAAAGFGAWCAADWIRRRSRTVQLRSGSPMAVPNVLYERELVVPREVTHIAAVDVETAAMAAPSAEPALDQAPALPEAVPELVVPDDERAADLVGEGLVLVVPERPEVADVARGAVDEVREVVPDGESEADRLAGGLADQADAGDPLAGGGAGVALQVHQVDPDADGDQGAEPQVDGVVTAAEGPGVGVVGERGSGGEVEDHAEHVARGHDQAVDQEA